MKEEFTKVLRKDWNTKNKIVKKEPINISQVFDDELDKLTDKNIKDICKNGK